MASEKEYNLQLTSKVNDIIVLLNVIIKAQQMIETENQEDSYMSEILSILKEKVENLI